MAALGLRQIHQTETQDKNMGIKNVLGNVHPMVEQNLKPMMTSKRGLFNIWVSRGRTSCHCVQISLKIAARCICESKRDI